MLVRALYEDEHIVVIQKPKRLAALAIQKLKAVPQVLAPSYCLNFRPVHRLDAGTFGMLIICKSRRGFGELSCQFNRKLVLKLYVCLCVRPSLGFVGSRGCDFGGRLKLTT